MKKIMHVVTIVTTVVIVVLLLLAAKGQTHKKNTEIRQWAEASHRYRGYNQELSQENEELKEYNRRLNISLDVRDDEIEILKKEKDKKVVESKTSTLVDTIQQVKPGVVHIMCPQWQGSGFVVGPNTIMTARHCVGGVEDFTITTDDGYKFHATRAISSKRYDVAYIYVDDLTCLGFADPDIKHKLPPEKVKLHPLELGSIKDCRLGQQIFAIGSPYGKVNFNAVSLGIISGLDVDWSPLGEDYGWEVAFTTDSAGHPGNSGGPLFTLDGKVRGILVGGLSPVLISVMPCDLFLDDLDGIELMFLQDGYQREIQDDVAEEVWGY